MTNKRGYGRLHESLVRNTARRVESNKPWHDSRPREAPCNGGVDPYPIRHGHRRIVLLEVAASGRVEPRRVKLRVSTRPIFAITKKRRVDSLVRVPSGACQIHITLTPAARVFLRGCFESKATFGLRSHVAEVHFSVIAAGQSRACNAARQRDYERCNIAGTTAKRRGGPQRCRACARRLLYCCSSPH